MSRSTSDVEGVYLRRAAAFLINDAAMKFRADERELGASDTVVASMLTAVPDARNRLARLLYDIAAEQEQKA